MPTPKALNADLGALGGRRLETSLPGLGAALEPAVMRSILADALLDEGASAALSCKLTAAVLLDAACVVVRYALDLVDAAGGVRSVLVTARVLGDPHQAEAYEVSKLAPLVAGVRGRAEVAPLRTPVAVIPSLAMVVHAYPVDGELPTLVAATDPLVAGSVLEELLAEAGQSRMRVTGCRVEPVHYNRRHRCMLRYHLEVAARGPVTVYGKVANDGSGARSPYVVAALEALLSESGVAVPRCLGFRPDLDLVLFSEIAGAPSVAQLLKARLRGEPAPDGLSLESAVETCGRIAAVLHTSDLRQGDPRPLPLELARLRAELLPMRVLTPDLSERLGWAIDTVEERAGSAPPAQLRQCHGDFSYTQLVFDGPRAGLVDFDNFCQAEPALDLGQFLAYLRYAGSKAQDVAGPDAARLTESLAVRFRTAYVGAGGSAESLDRVEVYEATNLIRMAEHAWQNLKSRRLHSVVRLLEQRLAPDRRGG